MLVEAVGLVMIRLVNWVDLAHLAAVMEQEKHQA